MKKNIGSLDKILRMVLALLIGILYFSGVIDGLYAYILMALGIILLITSLNNFCPLYLPFGFSTRKKN
jgi:hypothetical protein